MNPIPLLALARVLITLCVGVCAAAAEEPAEANRGTTLAAIHALENPHNLTRRGPRGELGPYQFREATWRAYTEEPFSRALDVALSEVVAGRHFDWIMRRLRHAGLPATTYNVALAWNCGLAAVVTGRATRAAHDYAQRAVNLVEAFAAAAAVPEPARRPRAADVADARAAR